LSFGRAQIASRERARELLSLTFAMGPGGKG